MLFKKSAQIIKIDLNQPDQNAIDEAVSALLKGKLVVYPTDTAYGLGVNAYDEKAVERLYQVKQREHSKPTHVICRDWLMITGICVTNKLAKILYDKYLPGPLTLILPIKEGVKFPELLTGGLPTLGVRVPNCPVTKAISQLIKYPFTTPSANKSAGTTPYCVSQVIGSLGIENVDLILDAGPLPEKPPSTIVSLAGGKIKILREGGISSKEIMTVARNCYQR